MQAFNVEIFSRGFDFICADTVDTVDYAFDYLHPEINSITMVTDSAIMQGDYIHMLRGDSEYFGIVSGVSSGDVKGTVEVEYKPFTSIFDTKILFDTDLQGQGTLENRLKAIIESYFRNNTDSLQNIPGLRVGVTSSTSNWGFNLKSDKEGMHHIICNFLETFIIRAMEKYRVAVTVRPNFSDHLVVLTIGTVSASPYYIEADLPNVITKNISIKESEFDVNKLVIYNTSNYTSTITYYRHTNDTYDTSNTDRITPVILETVAVDVDTETTTFAKVAASQASETFGSIEYNNLIELSVMPDDELLKPKLTKFGQRVIVKDGENEYNSIYTGCREENGLFTMIFGTVRMDLTKLLKRRK